MDMVTFNTKKPNLEIVVHPEHEVVAEGRIIQVRGERIKFDSMGKFQTNNPEYIELLRNKRYKDVDIFELDPEDARQIAEAQKQAAQQTPSSIMEHMNCPYCTKPFVTQMKYDQHLQICPMKTKEK
jgi:hypothetical protein